MDILNGDLIKGWAKTNGLNARVIDNGVMIKLKGESKAVVTIYWRTNGAGNAFEIAFNPTHQMGIRAFNVLRAKYAMAPSNISHKWPRLGAGVFSLTVLDDLAGVLV